MSVVMGDPPILAISDQTSNVTSEVVPSVPPDSSSTTAVDALLRKDAVGGVEAAIGPPGKTVSDILPSVPPADGSIEPTSVSPASHATTLLPEVTTSSAVRGVIFHLFTFSI